MKKMCYKQKALNKLLEELRYAILDGQNHQYLLGLIISIEILRDETSDL